MGNNICYIYFILVWTNNMNTKSCFSLRILLVFETTIFCFWFKSAYVYPVLRIHLILIRIRTLDPLWKRRIRIRIKVLNNCSKIYWFFNKWKIFQHVFLSAYFFCCNLVNHSEIFDLLLVKNFYLCFESNIFGFGWFFVLWISIFLMMRIKEAQMLRI